MPALRVIAATSVRCDEVCTVTVKQTQGAVASLLTGDPENADPVCSKSPEHGRVLAAIEQAAATPPERPLLFRNPRNVRRLHDET